MGAQLPLLALLASVAPFTTALLTSRPSYSFALAPRADICGGDSSLHQCGSNLPSSFCCPTGSSCVSLETSSDSLHSAICCPRGQSCEFIRPITCDASQQDPELHPGALIHLDDSSVELPRCGADACCPIGYGCQGGTTCKLGLSSGDDGTSSTPSPSRSTGTSPTGATSSIPVVVPSTLETGKFNLPTSAPITDIGPGHDPFFSGASFAAGWFPGMVAGALFCLLGLWFFRRRRAQALTRSSSQRKVKFTEKRPKLWAGARTVSEPVFNPNFGHRTDFLLRRDTTSGGESLTIHDNTPIEPSGKTSRSPPILGGATPRIRALFSRSPKPFMGEDADEDEQRAFAVSGEQPRPTLNRQPALERRNSSTSTVFTNSPVGTDRNYDDSSPVEMERGGSANTARDRAGSTGTIDIALPTLPSSTYTSPAMRRSSAATAAHHVQAPTPALANAAMGPDPHHYGGRRLSHNRVSSYGPSRMRNSTQQDAGTERYSFLAAPPLPPALRAPGAPGRSSTETTLTTFTGLMETAGFTMEDRRGFFVNDAGSPLKGTEKKGVFGRKKGSVKNKDGYGFV